MALTDISHPTDIAMLTDLYELTMAQGLWESGKANEQGCFTGTALADNAKTAAAFYLKRNALDHLGSAKGDTQ